MAAQNAVVTVKGNELTIKVNLGKNLGPSKSGKTTMIATTGGNQEVAPGTFLGLNVYKYANAK